MDLQPHTFTIHKKLTNIYMHAEIHTYMSIALDIPGSGVDQMQLGNICVWHLHVDPHILMLQEFIIKENWNAPWEILYKGNQKAS